MHHEGSHPTSERILRSALELMGRQGYARTSPAQVMKRSGVGQGSFYHHFPDKRALGLAVVDRMVGDTIAGFEQVFPPALSPRERIRTWVRAMAGQHRPPCDPGCPLGRLGLEMSAIDAGFRDSIGRGLGAVRVKLTETLREGVEVGQLDPSIDPPAMAELLLAGVEGALLLAQCDGDALCSDRALRQLERILDSFARPGARRAATCLDP